MIKLLLIYPEELLLRIFCVENIFRILMLIYINNLDSIPNELNFEPNGNNIQSEFSKIAPLRKSTQSNYFCKYLSARLSRW